MDNVNSVSWPLLNEARCSCSESTEIHRFIRMLIKGTFAELLERMKAEEDVEDNDDSLEETGKKKKEEINAEDELWQA